MKKDNYKIEFQHFHNDFRYTNTKCNLIKNIKGDEVTVGSGTTRIAKEDQFSRAVGRRYSFDRAIKEVESKEDRTIFWSLLKEKSPKTIKVKALNH